MATETEVIERLESAAETPAPPAETVKPEETPAAEPPKEVTTPAEQPTEGEPVEETEVDLDATPESSGDFPKYKPLFKENPELRQILGREKAFSELGQFSEVKSIIERVPTLEDAETLATQAENHRNLGETFRSDPAAFAESLKENDPLAFQQFAARLPEVLKQDDPELWTKQATAYTSEVLTNAFHIAQQTQDTELAKAVQLVHQALGLSHSAKPSAAVNPELDKLRKEKAERDQSDKTAQFDSFWNGTDEAITNASITEIEAQIKKAIPSVNQKQLTLMVRESWQKVLDTVGQQPQTVAQMETYRKNAMNGRGNYKEIVNYGTGRAKLVIPKAVKAVVDEFTRDVLKLNNETTEKKKAVAASTRDAGTGPQGTTSAAQLPSTNGKKRTSEDVFRELESKTYVPR
jgi:hypothetical protein